MKKFNIATKIKLAVGVIALSASASTFAEDFGCKALLCFAGGKNVSECQSTIKKVVKDMARGKSFPHCTMSDGVNQNDIIKVNTYKKKKKVRRIDISIDPKYADKDHQFQQFYVN